MAIAASNVIDVRSSNVLNTRDVAINGLHMQKALRHIIIIPLRRVPLLERVRMTVLIVNA